ncbi:MAG: signal peptide peptidase SppA [Deltaproteobacteria bacterium]|nr:signal peptide peptidase SppA [Deltaproteobacteria bacterium]
MPCLLNIKGPIIEATSYIETIDKYKDDNSIKAIVVRIDSPGGKVGSSQEIYSALVKLKEKKPVVVSMASIAASGGYYIACASDTIIALPGTLTGSIGVIAEFIDVSEGLQKLGVKAESITSGKMKDAGSPFRHMTDKERAYFESMVKDVYEQFIEVVSASRKLSMSEIRHLSDGRAFTGRQAYELGLIDMLGGLNDAIDKAKELSGLKGKVRIIKPEKRFGLIEFMTRLLNGYYPILPQRNSISRQYRLEYSLY